MDSSSTGDGRSVCLVGQWSQPIAEPGDQAPVVVEDRLEPTDFSPKN